MVSGNKVGSRFFTRVVTYSWWRSIVTIDNLVLQTLSPKYQFFFFKIIGENIRRER